MVDPYDWLGIPKAQRPPTPYQLLGLPETIADLVAIRSAADRQLRRILPHMSGEDALEAEALWTELEESRDLLLDADRRAEFDAQASTSEPAQEPATAAQTITAEWEEPATPSASGPEPWWKSAPEATAGGEAWWKQPLPAEAAVPPPLPPVVPISVAAKPVHVKPLGKVAPEVAAIGKVSRPRTKKKSVVPVLIGGLLVAAGIVYGIYYAVEHKSTPTVPKEEPVAVLPKTDSKPKGPGSVQPRHEDPVPEVPLPKDFADALRAKTFKGHAGAINGLAVASTGSRFVSVGTDKTLRIWSVTKDESILRHTFISPVMGVAWRDKDRQIIAADGLTLASFETAKSSAPRTSESTKGGVSALSVAVDGSKALTGLTDGFLRLWDTAGRPDEWAVAARGPINSVDISADGSLALAAVAEGPVSLWNLASRSRSHEWMPHPSGAIAVRFSPDGARAATSGPEGTATIYDLATKKEFCRLDGHAGPVTAIEWLPDGRQVVTVGVDSTARLWSAETGQPLRWNQPLDGKGNTIAVDPGGRFVLAGTTTGNIQLLPLPRVKPELFAGATAKPPGDPLPTPDAESATAAMADVRAELAREFTYNRPDDLALLADNLRRRATQERVSPSLRFGLLQESRALAIRAGDPLMAFKAIEDLAIWFDLDELHEKATTFASLPREADGPFLIGVGLEAAERAESDARPEIVTRLLQRLPAKAPANTPAERTTRLNAIRQRAAAMTTEMKAVRTALDVLKNASDDQASNHVYGTFLCFTSQDWSTGLPHLAKGTDPRFIEAAKADLSTPLDPKTQHRLGELWYGLAIDAKDHRAMRAMLARARTWFEREAKAKLEVVDAIKARARIEDISKLDVPSKDPTQLPLFAPVQIRRPYNTIAADVIKHEWRLDAGSEAQPERVLLPAGSPSLQSRFGLAAGGKLTLSFEPDGREVRVNCAGQETAFAGSGKSLRLVIERGEDKLTFRAVTDDGEPFTRNADLSPALRGPMSMTIRLTGTSARPGGTSLTSAILRGPASLPLPLAE